MHISNPIVSQSWGTGETEKIFVSPWQHEFCFPCDNSPRSPELVSAFNLRVSLEDIKFLSSKRS